MQRNTYNAIMTSGVEVDPHSITRTGGRQIDWDSVPDTYKDDAGEKVLPAYLVCSETLAGLLVPRSVSTTLTSLAVASNVATATKNAHGYSVGEKVYVEGASLSYANGLKTIATVPTANTFTFAAVGADASATGTIKVSRVATQILATLAREKSQVAALTGYGTIVGGVLNENLMPDATGTPKALPQEYKDELNAYGTGFSFQQAGDSLVA